MRPALRSCIKQPEDFQARSSVGERHLDVVDVVGSIPSAPTKIEAEVCTLYKCIALAFIFIDK